MQLESVKFVNIFRKDSKGRQEVAIIPITSPQKIRAYIDSGDLQPFNAKINDHGWRLDPIITAQIREILDDQQKLEEISKATSVPLDMINAFRVFMYEVGRNRAMAKRAAANSLDKVEAESQYEREVAAARAKLNGQADGTDEADEEHETASQRRRREASTGN